jgi:exodeoxyribonuclease-3
VSRHDWQANGEARHVGVRLDGCGVVIENVYIPAGGDEPDRTINPKFGQKLDFLGA